MNDNPSIYIVGLCFGSTHLMGMLDVVDQFCEKNFSGYSKVNIVVDNSIEYEFLEEKNSGVTISGDNKNLEFSGWQKGLEYIKHKYAPFPTDVCVLLNDTVHRRNYAVGGDRFFDHFVIQKSSPDWPARWAAGYLDDFPAAVSINGLAFSTWIRSNFVVFNWECTNLIMPLVFPCPESDLFVNDVAEGFWSADARLSENWKAYISSWLFGAVDPRFPEYRLKWIRSQPLSASNRDYFRQKAISILSEHYLTARLLSEEVKIFDFNTYAKLSDRHLTSYYK